MGDESVPYDIQERTFQFSLRIVKTCQKLCGRQHVTWALAKQLLDAGTSIGANMSEADVGQTKPDFIAKVSIARKEANETIYWLRLIAATDSDNGVVPPSLLAEATQIAKIVTAIKRNAERTPTRGV